MARSISRQIATASVALLAVMTIGTSAQATGTTSKACFDSRVDYLGRVPVANVGGVQYYRWTYRVTGMTCTNRALSHITLAICTQTQQSLSQISEQCTDQSDVTGGLITRYKSVIGKDATTGLSGLKWNFAGGNPINKANEWDEFSFVASGTETTIGWATKAAQIVVHGTTIGPACAPVPVDVTTWGGIKARFGS